MGKGDRAIIADGRNISNNRGRQRGQGRTGKDRLGEERCLRGARNGVVLARARGTQEAAPKVLVDGNECRLWFPQDPSEER